MLCSYLCRGRPVSLWRGESHLPSLPSANMRNSCCWTLDCDSRYSSSSPQKPPTTYTWVNDFRLHRDSLFRGRLIRGSDLYGNIYGKSLQKHWISSMALVVLESSHICWINNMAKFLAGFQHSCSALQPKQWAMKLALADNHLIWRFDANSWQILKINLGSAV